MTDGLPAPAAVAVAGVRAFADDLEQRGVSVERIRWRPPVAGTEHALEELAIRTEQTTRANDIAVDRMQQAHPMLVSAARAADVIEGMEPNTILHAGPPIEWGDMAGPLRGAVIGAALYEGLAGDPEDAAARAARGEFDFVPCHERGAVGPMAGVTSCSMPVWVIEDWSRGARAVSTFNEGLGRVLRYGAFGSDVVNRLRWMRDVLARVMAGALAARAEPVDVRALIAQALQMGDEGHNRNRASTLLLLRAMMPELLTLEEPRSNVVDSVRFVSDNDHFFLNIAMAAAKATADCARDVEGSSIVVAMARNGTEFGIQVSGTTNRWFTGPAGLVEGLYFPGYSGADANPDIGDSTITETIGLGGFAMAAGPAIVNFVGGSPDRALAATRSMYDITWAESRHYQIPMLSFRGTPLGIDCREVVHTGVRPVINTGIAHKDPGVGQIGAGIVLPPMDPFKSATLALAEIF